MFSTGVTRFLPTVITGSEERMTKALRNLQKSKEEFQKAHMPEAKAIAGFHVEGPHISRETGAARRAPGGARPPPDIDEFERWQESADGNIRS